MNQESADLIASLMPIATRFRLVMEYLRDEWESVIEDAEDAPRRISIFGMLKYFPGGCCDKTTMLMSRYFYEKGFSNVRSVYGYLGSDTTQAHEWIEVGDVIVDITADQFEEVRPLPTPVIVTVNRGFHDRYIKLGELCYTERWIEWRWDEDPIATADWMYSLVSDGGDLITASHIENEPLAFHPLTQ